MKLEITTKMNKKSQNPALQEEPIGEPASIITPRENESLFRWIRGYRLSYRIGRSHPMIKV